MVSSHPSNQIGTINPIKIEKNKKSHMSLFRNIIPSSASEFAGTNEFEFLNPNSNNSSSQNLKISPNSKSGAKEIPNRKSAKDESSPSRKLFGFSLFNPIVSPKKSNSQTPPKRHVRTTSFPEQQPVKLPEAPTLKFEKFALEKKKKEDELEESSTPTTRSRSKSSVQKLEIKEIISTNVSPLMSGHLSSSHLPSFYVSEHKQKQRVVVVKYYEEKGKFAKIIPRTIPFIQELRVQLKFEREQDLKTIEAEALFYLIKNDHKWLNKVSPIQSIYHYDEKTEVFSQVEPETKFDILEQDETILTFHIVREIKPSKLIEESTLIFDDVAAAKKKVTELTETFKTNEIPDYSVRYYDLLHHAYVKLVKGDAFPISRFSSSAVKILVEKLNTEKVESDDEVLLMEEQKLEVIENEKRTFELYLDFTRFVDKTKLPLKEHLRSDLEEARGQLWAGIKTPTTDKEVRDLKATIRMGIPFSVRKKVYLVACGVTTNPKMKDLEEYYLHAFTNVFGTFYKKKDLKPEDVSPSIYPEFGGKLNPDEHCYLTRLGIESVKRLLCVLASCTEIEYCPQIVELVCLLIKIMEEHEVFACVSLMLERSKKDAWYLRTSKLTHQLFLEAFKDIVKKNLPSVLKHSEKLGFDFETFSIRGLNTLFLGLLPYEWVWRILDSYMNEGLKVMLRAGCSILKILEKELIACKSKNEIEELLGTQLVGRDEQNFFRYKYKVPIKRRHIENSDAKNKSQIPPNKLEWSVTMYTRPKVADESEILLNPNQWEVLCSWLPWKNRLRTLKRVFTTRIDGYSLSQLYHLTNDIGATLILISACPVTDVDDILNYRKLGSVRNSKEFEKKKDGKDSLKFIKKEVDVKRKSRDLETTSRVFNESPPPRKVGSGDVNKKKSVVGVYLGESLEKSFQYEGTADSFVFSLCPKEAAYKWTKKNDYFSYGSNDFIRFGGGGDGPALQIDDNITYGSSVKSQTFGNEPLCGDHQHFMVLKLEVYKFE